MIIVFENHIEMELKLIGIVLLICVAVKSNVIHEHDYDEDAEMAFGVKIYKPTRECSMAGGICVSENDCAQDQLTQRRGLCSEPNVECCYDVAPKQAPCREFGGQCSAANECTKDLHQPLANDCGSKVCCILVN